MPDAPPAHPEPSESLHNIALPLRQLASLQVEWWRLSRSEYPSTLHWGKARRYRFDDPLGEYGVLYLGQDSRCAFIETFGDSRGINGTLELAEADLNDRFLAMITVPETLKVVDLTGPGLANIGADARLTESDDYQTSRSWSRAIWQHPRLPDGICYRARHDPELINLALFDRASLGVAEHLRGSLAESKNAAHLSAILKRWVVSLL